MGLCQRNLYNLRHADFGFAARNLVENEVNLGERGLDESRRKQFYGTVRRTIAALPGVESVTLAQSLPLLGGPEEIPVQSPNGAQAVAVGNAVVDGDYFATFGIPVLTGHTFDSRDRESSPGVIVINHKMAEMFWPGQEPVGKTVVAGNPGRKLTVVGVARDVTYGDIDEAVQPLMYEALSQNYRGWLSVVAKTKGDPNLWVKPFAQALRGLGLIIIQPVTYERWMDLTLVTQRIAAGCVAVLSSLGLLLAIIGIYGVISYSVRERRKELGVRVALGARPRQLLQMVLRQTAVVAGAGVGLGVLAGIGGTVLLRSQFFGIGAVEWRVLIPVSCAMMAVSLAIAYLSARPWVTIHPMEAVRHA